MRCGEPLAAVMTSSQHVCEVRPRKDHRGVDLISDALPFGRLWYTKPDDAIDYAKFRSRSHDAMIRVYDDAGNVVEKHTDRKDSSKSRVRETGWRPSHRTRVETTGK